MIDYVGAMSPGKGVLIMKMREFCVLLIVTATPAFAQFAPGQDGRANDANNQIGSGGHNAPVQQTFFNTANLYVTGNVTNGRAFQGFSPIRDTSSLFLSLPSSNIGLFQRDSIGVSQVHGHGLASSPRPFFNPAQTVTGIVGIQQGINTPGGSVPKYTTSIPQGSVRTPYGVPNGLSYGLNYNPPVVPNSSIYTTGNYPLVEDLYGSPVAAGIEALRSAPQYGQTITNTYPVSRIGDREADGSLLNRRMREIDPLMRHTRSIDGDDEPPTSDQMLANSRNLLSPSSLAPHLFDRDAQGEQRDALTGRPLPTPPRYAGTPDNVAVDPASGLLAPISRSARRDLVGAGAPHVGDLGAGETTVVEGYHADDFADDGEMIEDGLTDDSVRSPQSDSVVQSAVAALGGAPTRDFSDFDDRNRAKVNQLVSQAERHVAAGDFYKAGNAYDLAITFDPRNAFIRFGYGHALLAAGEYLTAVHQIVIGIDLLPRIHGFQPNFTALAGQQQILDVRRADLEKRLDRKDDYRLRFLLGYTEYYTGLEKFGLPNLQKAAKNAPADSLIARFPDMLDASPSQPAVQTP